MTGRNFLSAALVVAASISLLPAFADDGYYHDWNRYNNDWNLNNNDNRYNNWDQQRERSNYFDNLRAHRRAMAMRRNWQQQREMYRSNWDNMRDEHRAMVDQEMRDQWNAYHHNNWNGDYGWQNYNEPGFLNYLHRNNPGLMNRISNYLGL